MVTVGLCWYLLGTIQMIVYHNFYTNQDSIVIISNLSFTRTTRCVSKVTRSVRRIDHQVMCQVGSVDPCPRLRQWVINIRELSIEESRSKHFTPLSIVRDGNPNHTSNLLNYIYFVDLVKGRVPVVIHLEYIVIE